MFNSILREVGVGLAETRLVRHQDLRATRGRTPYALWRDKRPDFELYQSIQNVSNRAKLRAPHWAVFIADLDRATMFAGVYDVKYGGILKYDTPSPCIEGAVDKAGSCDVYELTLSKALDDVIGRLYIDWGAGALAWVQYADRHDKKVVELRTAFQEPPFPGFVRFIEPLSRIEKLPRSWITALRASRGVYLLTCPKTKEQYVGSATSENGFWGRWLSYIQSGHGGNKGLMSRDPSDYQVSILEVAGTMATSDDILAMEGRWQQKLQSREMGLNRNIAKRL